MTRDGKQDEMGLHFGAYHAPIDAPDRVLRQIESEAMALAVSIEAGHYTLAYIAARIGKSESYVSRMRSGKRPIPRKLVGPLCAATGTNLLRQYIWRECDVPDVVRLGTLLRGAQ